MNRKAILGAALILFLPGVALAGNFKDPEDGAFDLTDYLLHRKGALPLPILITEPAVGYGGGLGLMFFRQSYAELSAQEEGRTRYRPPNMFGGAGFGTENGTWGAVGGAKASFDQDCWRLSGGGGYVNANLTLYEESGPSADYNLKASGGTAKAQRRLGRTDGWISAHGRYFVIENTFDQGALASYVDGKRRIGGLGPSIEYDTRDNVFTPGRGWIAYAEAMLYDPAFGGDESFRVYRAHAYGYAPLPGPFVLGTRVDGATANGDVPFYMLPYLGLRGIPALRYQGENTALAEAELRWNLTSRWALLGFYGAGRAWGSRRAFDEVDTHDAGGTGFRYQLARRLGMYSGIDFAWGPQFAFYLQIGSAWH